MKTSTLLRILLITIVLLASCIIANNIYLKEKALQNQMVENKKEMENITFQNKVYKECIETPYQSEELALAIEHLKKEYESMGIAFYFKDIRNEFAYSLNENELFYGASIIKLLEANYLINEAMNNKISLEEKIVYQQKHKQEYSLGLENYEIGEEISLRNLIYYALSVSDNTAHEMLYEYIGIEKLKTYAYSLDIELTINAIEHYGYLSAEDGMKIIEEAYKIIRKDNNHSKLLKRAMNNDYYNSLNFKEKTFLHKYGLTENYYNEIGIFLNEEPYLLSIFTTKGYEDYKKIVSELSEKIYNIYNQNKLEKQKYCNEIKNIIFDTF